MCIRDSNIITGLHRGLQDLLALGWIDRLPKLMAVQASGSSAIYNAWASGADDITPVQATTVADSIAADLPRDGLRALRAIRQTGGKAIQVTDAEILAAIPPLARLTGVFAEPAGAAALAGLQAAMRDQGSAIAPEATVVLMITGNGLKDIGSAMKASGQATIIEPTLAAVKKALKTIQVR